MSGIKLPCTSLDARYDSDDFAVEDESSWEDSFGDDSGSWYSKIDVQHRLSPSLLTLMIKGEEKAQEPVISSGLAGNHHQHGIAIQEPLGAMPRPSIKSGKRATTIKILTPPHRPSRAAVGMARQPDAPTCQPPDTNCLDHAIRVELPAELRRNITRARRTSMVYCPPHRSSTPLQPGGAASNPAAENGDGSSFDRLVMQHLSYGYNATGW